MYNLKKTEDDGKRHRRK